MTIALDGVMQDIALAHGLPNPLYTDPLMFETEKHRVFARNWAAIGIASDVPSAGSVMPLRFLGEPLLMVRNRRGEIRVFENVCRHRGMILVEEPGQLKGPITCPYHAWAYDLDGQLRATPHIGGPDIHSHPQVDPDQLGLNSIRCHVWQDIVFVNLDGGAEPFSVMHQPLLERWNEFDKPVHFGGADSRFSLTVESNWKLAVENYCESYHLPFVHPGLNSYSRLEDHYHINGPGGMSGQGTLVYAPSLEGTTTPFPNFPGLSSRWDNAAEYIALFPNVLLGIHRDHFYSIILDPLSFDSTEERVAIYYADAAVCTAEYASRRAANSSLWKGIFEEDIGVVEGMYRGRSAKRYDGGKFSPVMDNPTHYFHAWIAEQMQDQGAR